MCWVAVQGCMWYSGREVRSLGVRARTRLSDVAVGSAVGVVMDDSIDDESIISREVRALAELCFSIAHNSREVCRSVEDR